MAQFTIWNDQVLSAPAVPSNGQHELIVSPVQQNRATNIEIYVEYSSPVPDFGTVPQTWRLYALVEKNFAGRWVPLVEQATGWASENNGNRRMFVVSTGVGTDSDGVEFWPTEDTRELRKYGRVEYDFRVKILLDEWGAGGPGAFQSANVTVFGDTYGG